MRWRRLFGTTLMTLGGATIAAMTALASLAVGNYVEWENAADALGTVALMTLPPALAGALLLAAGRLVYGEWTDRAPVLNATAAGIRLAGFVVAIGLGAILLLFALTGITSSDLIAALVLGLGTAAGIGLIILGFLIKPSSGRRYLD